MKSSNSQNNQSLNEVEADVIEVPVWAGHGTGRLIRRDCLPPEHPESEWNYILRTYPGVNPFDYGARPPREICKGCGRPREEY